MNLIKLFLNAYNYIETTEFEQIIKLIIIDYAFLLYIYVYSSLSSIWNRLENVVTDNLVDY